MEKRLKEKEMLFELRGWKIIRSNTNTGIEVYACFGKCYLFLGSYSKELA